MTTPKITVHEKLLLAAAGLEDAGRQPFTAEDLVVAAWRLDPETFGLAGHNDSSGRPSYPNSNRVFVEIMGSKPIRKQGLLAKAGTKKFRLTESGRQRVRELRTSLTESNGKPAADAKVSFDRDTSRKLQKLLKTRAVEKLRSGRGDEITFTDASSFWGITARSTAMTFRARLGDVEGVLRAAEQAAEQRPTRFEHGGRAYTKEGVHQLLELHRAMLDNFAEQLDVIRSRRDER
ncbi:MAG: hypothetical protein ACRDSN_18540 [Pseudonocardiaceae bacterium]